MSAKVVVAKKSCRELFFCLRGGGASIFVLNKTQVFLDHTLLLIDKFLVTIYFWGESVDFGTLTVLCFFSFYPIAWCFLFSVIPWLKLYGCFQN